MKGILKLFPIAAAALAFASCSDDLSTSQSVNEIPSNALRFSMEGNSTRAGFVGGVMDAGSALSFRWVKDDAIRVYNGDLANWDMYTYAGDDFATQDVFTPHKQNSLQSFSIGVYPADQVVGVYMDKDDKDIKHIQMALPSDPYAYQEGLDTDASGSAGYRCDIPMYGAITSTASAVTEMNRMSAMVRVYLRDLPKDAKYVVLVSDGTNAATQPLTGRFIADVPKTITQVDAVPADFTKQGKEDNSPILLKDETFSSTWGNIVYARVNATKYTTEAGTDAAAKDSSAICFPVLANNSTTQGARQEYDHLTLYAWGDNTNVSKTPADVTDWADELANGNAVMIADRQWTPSRRGATWVVRYTDTYYLDVDTITTNSAKELYPGVLTNAIKSKAATAINMLYIKPISSSGSYNTALMAKAGYNYNHIVDIPAMKYGADITLDLTGTTGTDNGIKLSENTSLQGDFAGKLYIKQGKDQCTVNTAKWEINLPNAEVFFLTDGTNTLTNIDIQQAKSVTLGDGTTSTTFTSGKNITVRDGKLTLTKGTLCQNIYAVKNVTNNTVADEILIKGGAKATNIYNATKTNISAIGEGTDEAKISYVYTYTNYPEQYTLADPITIYTEGKASIISIFNRNSTTPTQNKYLTIKSKLTEESTGVKATTDIAGKSLNNGSTAAIYTAAQLVAASAAGISAETIIMADEIDLNSLSWVGGAVEANVAGYNHNAGTKTWKVGPAASEDGTYPTATKKNVIKNLALTVQDANGLFGNIDATSNAVEVAGIEINAATYSDNEDTENQMIGALAGQVKMAETNDIKITNVKATDVNFSGRMEKYVGGLIGQVTGHTNSANLIIDNAKVAATAMKARAFVGGLIGGIKETVTKIDILNAKASVTTYGLLLKSTSPTLYPSYAGTFASFIGGTENNPTVAINIYNSDYGTAINKITKGGGVNNQSLRFGANATSSDVPFFGGNPWIGFCGTLAGESATTLTVYKKTAGTLLVPTAYTKYAYDTQKMVATQYTGASTYSDGSAVGTGITYDGSNAAGHNINKYGTTIYNDYDTSSLPVDFLGYNNTYVDGITIN